MERGWRIVQISSVNGQRGQYGQGELLRGKGRDDRRHQGAGFLKRRQGRDRQLRRPRLCRYRHGRRRAGRRVEEDHCHHSGRSPRLCSGDIARTVLFLVGDDASFVTGRPSWSTAGNIWWRKPEKPAETLQGTGKARPSLSWMGERAMAGSSGSGRRRFWAAWRSLWGQSCRLNHPRWTRAAILADRDHLRPCRVGRTLIIPSARAGRPGSGGGLGA